MLIAHDRHDTRALWARTCPKLNIKSPSGTQGMVNGVVHQANESKRRTAKKRRSAREDPKRGLYQPAG